MKQGLRDEITKRSGGFCELCGGQATEIHHIIGGRGKRRIHEAKENLIHLCPKCHWMLHSSSEEAKRINARLRHNVRAFYEAQGLSEEEIREKMGGKVYD